MGTVSLVKGKNTQSLVSREEFSRCIADCVYVRICEYQDKIICSDKIISFCNSVTLGIFT
jgi:hypothetical protein